MKKNANRIPIYKEWLLLTKQYITILFYDRRNLIISLAFPVLAALIHVWIAGENMFVHYDGTKSACFVLVSAAIWGGLFNSIQMIVKDRANIKRDFDSGLRLGCYTGSRAAIQMILCAVQSLLLCSSLIGIQIQFGNNLPKTGLVFKSSFWEYYISLFLLMCAADAMGIFISSIVKKQETANVLAPYILIVQLIFSGILFSMKGIAEKISYIMLSRWGMEGLGCISNLNGMPLKIQLTISSVPHEAEDMYLYTSKHLFYVWIILAGFSIGFILLGNLFLHGVERDSC